MSTKVIAGGKYLPLGALLAADGASRMGNAVTVIAVPLLALHIEGTPWAVAAAGVAATLPLIVGGAVGGVIVDRMGFRRASVFADALSGLTVVAIPILTLVEALPFWALLLLVFVSNLFDAPGHAARSSQIPELCEIAGVSLSKTTAWKATISRTATLVGASLAGLLVAIAGAAPTMFGTASLFAVAIALTVAFVPRVRLRGAERQEPVISSNGWEEMTAGIRFVARTPLVRAVVLLVVFTNAIDVAGTTVLFPLYAAELGGEGALLGVMIACFAGGALVGAALYGLIGDRVPRHTLFVTLFAVAGLVPFGVLAVAPPFPVVMLALIVSGVAAGPLNPLIDSALLRLIPPPIRARVLGAISAGVTAGMPLGSLLAGLAVTGAGLTATLVLAAAAYVAVILATAFGRRWRDF